MINKLTLILVLLYLNCPAQSDSILININQAVEDLIEEPEEETDDSDFYELIEFYIEHPVNINTAGIKELDKLPYLDMAAVQLIISHRAYFGNYFSANELYSVKGLPEELVTKILPFLSTGKPKPPDKQSVEPKFVSVNVRTRIIKDLRERQGFKDHKFEGSSLHIYNRFNIEYNSFLQTGILTEKDAGEKSYYDFLSGYLNLSNRYGFKNIIIGDYHVRFGQGLALWNSYGFSKGTDAVFSIKKSAGTIKPSTSSSENNFFRGAAFNYEWEHAGITGFYSRSSLDALIDSTEGITSLSIDGLHRTPSELLKRDSVTERAAGLVLDYSFSSHLSAGLLYYNVVFDHPFIPSNIFDIKGDNFNYYSAYIDLYLYNFNIYGEFSYNGITDPAYITGFKLSPTPEFCYSMLLRNYPPDYISIHGSGFGERSGARGNESGIYNGIRWRTKIGTFNFYYDQFKFPYSTFTNPLPSEGNDFMLRFTTRLFHKFEAGIQIRVGNKETVTLMDSEEKMAKRIKQSLRLEYSYALSSRLKLKTRFEYVSVLLKDSHLQEEGYLFYEDIRFMPINGFLLYGRIIFFRSASFNSAVYEYENDLTGMLSSRGLYGEGARFYAVVRYNPLSKVSLSLKYSETFKPKETSTGSGYQQIEGSIDNRIALQADINF